MQKKDSNVYRSCKASIHSSLKTSRYKQESVYTSMVKNGRNFTQFSVIFQSTIFHELPNHTAMHFDHTNRKTSSIAHALEILRLSK